MGDRLRYAIAPPNWGPFGDPREAARLAAIAEASGWDGYFTWDSLAVRAQPPPAHDPWVLLAAVADATSSIRVGTCIAVVGRHHPVLLARTIASLDVLSEGRLILGVGLGDDVSPDLLGHDRSAAARATRLDDALDVMTRLWAGDRVRFERTSGEVDSYELRARPVQQPRPPIWVGGDSPGALRRAARWDGWIGPDAHPERAGLAELRAVRASLRAAGAAEGGFDIAWAGGGAPDEVTEAGGTWRILPALGEPDDVRRWVERGPVDP